MDNNYYKSPKSNWIKRLFWRACGADRYLLERSTYSDQIKYFCLGGIVVATGVMAAMAGGYAFYTIFEPKGDALQGMLTQDLVEQGISAADLTHWPTVIRASLFGIIWGLIIYNIDRFIVTSTGKGDGTEAITRQEIKSAIPRLIMGAIIALTISKPVEIRMFDAEIRAAVSELQNKERQEEYDKIDELFSKKLEKKEAEKEKWDQKTREKDSLAVALQPLIQYEIDHGGCHDKCESYKAEQQKYRDDIERIENGSTYLKLIADIENIEIEKDNAKEEANEKIKSMDGLLLKLKLAHQEAGWLISLFITLLFMVIELTPIFFKMMLIKGPYDYMEENVKELARAELGIEIEYDFYTGKEGVDKHKVTNHAAQIIQNQKIATLKAQDELNKAIIEKWKEKELKKINENPDDYIQT